MLTYQPRSILVTGGAGFIGSNFIRHLLSHESDICVVNLDKLTYAGSLDNLKNLPRSDQYQFVQGDITDTSLVESLLRKHNIDTVVHFAAESHVDRSITSAAAFVETNIMGTYVLLEASRQYWLEEESLDHTTCRFHHISTDEVFGTLQTTESPFTEKTPYKPRSPYSATKASADHLVNAYFHTYGLPITISNCSNNYGPYQHSEKFIPTIIRACIKGHEVPIYGNGKNIRDWLYVEDHCHALISIIQHGKIGESYNIGGNNEWENIALAKYICEEMDRVVPNAQSHTALIKHIDDRLGHDFRYAIDHAKLQNQLNWSCKESFSSGIKKTIAYYIKKFSETA